MGFRSLVVFQLLGKHFVNEPLTTSALESGETLFRVRVSGAWGTLHHSVNTMVLPHLLKKRDRRGCFPLLWESGARGFTLALLVGSCVSSSCEG